LAEAATVAAFEDDAYFKACRDKIIATREWTVKELEVLGFSVLPSQANFVFAKPSTNNAAALAQKLREHKILVRYFGAARINEFLRITIGTDEQMQRMIDVLKSA
jgi:histidinol-phosphate aminotransferase